MAKRSGNKPKTVLGTIGTLLIALLIYFLQGGKGGSETSKTASKPSVSQAKPASTVVEEPSVPLAEPVAPEKSQLVEKKQVKEDKTQISPTSRSRWHKSNLERHWEKHRAEFPEYHSAEEYGEAVAAFVDNPPEGTLRKTTAEGDQMFYHPPSNRFAVATADGVIKTCFKPDQGIRYWNRQ